MYKLPLLLLTVLISLQSLAQRAGSADHRKRQDQYDVSFYFLDLNLEAASNAISGNVLIRSRVVAQQMDTFAIELSANYTIDSVKASLDGGSFASATIARNGKDINVLLPFSARDGQTLEVRTWYRGNASVANPLVGQFNSGIFTGSGHRFSASPPYNSSTWFPCKQVLTDKADSSWFFITTSSTRAISNGLLTAVVPVDGGKTRFEWKSSYPIAFYLIAFVVGNQSERTEYWKPAGRNDSLLLKFYGTGLSATRVSNILQVFSDQFGLYPFYREKLAFVNVNFPGGMENQTMIVQGAAVEVHELAHQWWGDHVTCSSWKDVFINESFATWCESLYDELTTTGDKNAARMAHFTNHTTSAPVYRTFMDTNSVASVFNSDIYKKGAMVINSLRFHINDDSLFFKGLRNFLEEFGGKAASAVDLRVVMEATTGIGLVDFFNQWYYKGGAPTFNITWNQVNNRLMLQINQTTNLASNPLFKTPVEIRVRRSEGDTIIRLFIANNVSYLHLHCPGTITGFSVDPNQWISNGNGTVTKDLTLDIFSAGVNGPENLCLGETSSFLYTAIGTTGHTYQWSVEGGAILSGEDGAQVSVRWETPGNSHVFLKECNAAGTWCDSVTFNVLVSSPAQLHRSLQICPGDSLFSGGAWQKTAGNYIDTLQSIAGCDSTVITELIVRPPAQSYPSIRMCAGDSIFAAGAWRREEGTYTDIFQSSDGCDSTVVTSVTVDPVHWFTNTVLLHAGDSVFVENAWQTEPGTYTDHYISTSGCDSTVVTHIEVITSLGEPSGQPGIRLFPNPADDRLMISGAAPESIITVYNLTGALCLKKSNYSANQWLNTSSLEKGLYLVQVYDPTSSRLRYGRFVKQ